MSGETPVGFAKGAQVQLDGNVKTVDSWYFTSDPDGVPNSDVIVIRFTDGTEKTGWSDVTLWRGICTHGNSYTFAQKVNPIMKFSRWSHPHAELVEQEDGYPGGDLATYKCPICKHTWTEELPQ